MYCGGNTKIINSRLHSRTNQTWRRRQCLKCKSVVTTLEQMDMTKALIVRNNSGQINRFMPEKLFLSIYESLKHRSTAIQDAKYLSQTITTKLSLLCNGKIESKTIAETTLVALNRFDKVASAHYNAFHDF